MSNDHVTTISHPAFNCIVSANTGVQPRVIAFVTKSNTVDMTVTPRPYICQGSDIQVLDILTSDLLNLLMFNVYNEKQIGSEDHEYIVERRLEQPSYQLGPLSVETSMLITPGGTQESTTQSELMPWSNG